VSAPAAPQVPVEAGLFTDGGAPALLGSRCTACQAHHFPAHQTCPYCSSDGVEACELSRTGVLWAWTAVTAAPPGYRGEVPYGFGVVELPEGIRVVTRLTEPDPTRLEGGQAMVLAVVPLHVDDEGRQVTTFAFAPVPTPGPAPT
jgi:uncharacterized OB-fold protein